MRSSSRSGSPSLCPLIGYFSGTPLRYACTDMYNYSSIALLKLSQYKVCKSPGESLLNTSLGGVDSNPRALLYWAHCGSSQRPGRAVSGTPPNACIMA